LVGGLVGALGVRGSAPKHHGGAFGKSKPQVVIQTNGQMAGLMNNSDFKLHLCKCGCSQIFATGCRASPGKRGPELKTRGTQGFRGIPWILGKPGSPGPMHLQLNAPKAASFCANAQFVCVNTFVSPKRGFIFIKANIKDPIDKKDHTHPPSKNKRNGGQVIQ